MVQYSLFYYVNFCERVCKENISFNASLGITNRNLSCRLSIWKVSGLGNASELEEFTFQTPHKKKKKYNWISSVFHSYLGKYKSHILHPYCESRQDLQYMFWCWQRWLETTIKIKKTYIFHEYFYLLIVLFLRKPISTFRH